MVTVRRRCACCTAECLPGRTRRIGLGRHVRRALLLNSRMVQFTCVAGLTAVSHQGMLAERSGFVIAGLEDGGATHRSLRGGDDGEVLASDSE